MDPKQFYVMMENGEFRYGCRMQGGDPGKALVQKCDTVTEAYGLCAQLNRVVNAYREARRPSPFARNWVIERDTQDDLGESTLISIAERS